MMRSMAALAAHSRRWLLLSMSLVLLSVFTGVAVPASAEERVDALPFVNNFATARFRLLTTAEIEGVNLLSYGGGEVVLPSRSHVWLGSDQSPELINIILIDSMIYQRIGSGEWERTDVPVTTVQAQPVSAQFNELQQLADAIIDFGPENVGDVPAVRYQVWLSGEKVLGLTDGAAVLPAELRDLIAGATFKYDFWIGAQDSFLYQQNTVVILPPSSIQGVDLPELRASTLLTYYDINYPNISVNAPI